MFPLILDYKKATLKISQPTPKAMVKLDQFLDVHRTGKERNVGRDMIIKFLMSIPQSYSIESSFDILYKYQPVKFQEYRCQSTEIEQIKA